MVSSRFVLAFFLIIMPIYVVHALNDMPLLTQLQGEHNMSSFGYSMVSLDFNHDGCDDLIVLSAGYGYQYQQSPARGKVYIYYGGTGFNSSSEPAMTLEGDYPEGMLRRINSVRNVGDVNGDGYDDLMIEDAIPNVSSSSRYMYYFGGISDLSTPDRIEVPIAEENIYWIAKLGDVDGDGFGDVGIFYQTSIVSGFDIQWGGTFYRQVILSGSGIAAYPNAITGIGDTNGDGYDDFAVGYAIGGYNVSSYTVTIYYGSQDRIFVSPWVLAFTAYQITCISKPLGDLNGDGYSDFLGYVDYQGLKIWMGADDIEQFTPDLILNPLYYGDLFVEGIEAGDVNGDGLYDVVGASFNDQRFAVWLGSSNMNGQSDWTKFNQYEKFGYDLAMGDFNGDGFCDIAVSAPFEEGIWPTHDFRGYVFIYAGNPGMVANDDPSAPQLSDQIQMRLSPNPVRNAGEISIAISGVEKGQSKTVRVELFNLKGQIVHQSEIITLSPTVTLISFELSSLPSGVYICRARIGNMSTSKKLTIIK